MSIRRLAIGHLDSSRRTRLSGALLALSLTTGLAACGDDNAEAGEETFNARIAAYHDESTAIVQAMDWWATEVEKRSEGRIKFDRFYGAALLDATGMRDGVAANQAEVGNFAPGYHPGDFPLTEGLLTVPFTTTSPAAAMEAIRQLYRETDEAQAEYQDQGLELIAPIAAAEGAWGMTKEWDSLDDLKGRAVRGYEGGGINAGLRAVGANPTDLDAGEMYESLQRGVIDGFASMIVDAGVTLSLDEVAKYWQQVGMGVVASAVIAANKEWYDSLPADLQEIMAETADEMTAVYMELLAETDEVACDALEQSGVEVTAFPQSEQNKLRDLIHDDQVALFESEASGSIDDAVGYYESYKTLVAEAESEFPEESGVGRCVG